MKFLSKIVVNSKLVRKKEHTRKVWIDEKLDEPIEVTVIGKRTLRNGRVETDFYPDQGYVDTYFVPDEYIKALLVVKDIRSNPFYILESSINVERTYRIIEG